MVNKYLATIISFFLPGIGELIQGGETKKNIIIFIIYLILGAIMFSTKGSIVYSILAIIILIYCIYFAYDTYKMSE